MKDSVRNSAPTCIFFSKQKWMKNFELEYCVFKRSAFSIIWKWLNKQNFYITLFVLCLFGSVERIECENTVVGVGWVGKQQEGETETES